jgi:PIN domain nuclease of toxin-antitoxin system
MGILLDTHAFLWFAEDSPLLSSTARSEIINTKNVQVSIASLWELSIKFSLGKLDIAPHDFRGRMERYIRLCRAEVLPVLVDHTVALTSLPMLHRDPFDRMLIAQSIAEGVPIVTHDRQIREYACNVVW